jgi:hypothetical protein
MEKDYSPHRERSRQARPEAPGGQNFMHPKAVFKTLLFQRLFSRLDGCK